MKYPGLSRILGAVCLGLLALSCLACSSSGSSPDAGTSGPPGPVARHSSSIALSPDGAHVYVVNADADSVSVIDTAGRTLEREIPLGSAPPAVDGGGRFTPSVGPRALALSPRAGVLYVTGERSGKLYSVDLATSAVTSIAVGSEPTGVLVAPDESAVFVACSNDGTVVRVDAGGSVVSATAHLTDGSSALGFPIQAKPWALGWSVDGATLYVTHFLASAPAPAVSGLDPATLDVTMSVAIPDVPSRGNKLLANGQGRAFYDVVARPGTSGELWVPHLMLATTTAQPALDFESTAFPTVSVLKDSGAFVTRMSNDAMSVPAMNGVPNGAFGDVVSGPHAIEFTPDGRWALVLDSASEDVLAVDADGRVEASLLRPLVPLGSPLGHLQEGLVLSADGKRAYVDERNTGDVAVLSVDTSGGTIALTVDGPAIGRLAHDPMPAGMRAGQLLFFTANSDVVPITTNHWLACASCHPEGRSDAVTWRFLEGPRDTPSNAGGVSDTGFLLRTAQRRAVFDYWQTINVEQGGSYSPTATTAPTLANDHARFGDLEDLQDFVNHALPAPVPPTTDPALVATGETLFFRTDVKCNTCHVGPAHTDSGLGNPGLDLSRHIELHDVGTCVTTGFPDAAQPDELGHPRSACDFDTPTLRGIADSAPYLHDGSAATLRDVLEKTRGRMGDIRSLSSSDLDALVEYLRSL